ncbi:hypothetical protein BJ165DRAFT_1521341 [Panaeolus papilionaceus]|nr:hypothetical protein BJ165DRAFT_1521341 [Panaeolus papilionaceus]
MSSSSSPTVDSQPVETAKEIPSVEPSEKATSVPPSVNSEGLQTPKAASSPAPQDADQSPTAPSSNQSTRPMTRSQTGSVSKRRHRDDSEPPTESTKKRTPVSRKRQKTASASATPATEEQPAEQTDNQEQEASTSTTPPVQEPAVGLSTSLDPPTNPPTELTFYHASPMSEDQLEVRMPRTRATLPTPIPNLTKKSRGRRVPTTMTPDPESDPKDVRLYVCKVEGCGKCFHRGEHLKRHIRSIHTHEKPFKCTYPLCEKFFNRHDNLLQHLKVHRGPTASSTPPPTDSNTNKANPRIIKPNQALQSDSPHSPAASASRPRERSFSPEEEHDEPESPAQPSVPRTIYNAFPASSYRSTFTQSVSYGSPTEPVSFMTNMAVSSLRTEIPQSPTVEARPFNVQQIQPAVSSARYDS